MVEPRRVPGICRHCDSAHEPHTSRTPSCTVCTRFSSLRSNAAKVRRTGVAPGLGFSLSEFAEWFARQPRECAYCRIPESLIEELGVRTQVGLPLQRLGVDRLDGERGYELENIVLCCFSCNKVRSNTFSADEMAIIAPGISAAWSRRLAKVGITWSAAGGRGRKPTAARARR